MQEQEARKAIPSKSSKFTKSRVRQWLAAVLVLICISVSSVGTIDSRTEGYIDGAIKQALFAYAGARTLNAGISFLQSAEFGGKFFVSASIQPFQLLDPVDDMVEDYATAMKYSIGSLMIQRLLVKILSTDYLKRLTLLMGIILLVCLALNASYTGPIFKGFLFVTMIRLLFVVSIFLSGVVDRTLINSETENEMNQVTQTKETLRQYGIGDENSNDPAGSAAQYNDSEEQRARLLEAKKERDIAEQNQMDAKKELEGFGLIERLKVGYHSDEYLQAKNDYDKATTLYREKEEELKGLEEEIGDLEKDDSFITKMKGKIASLKNLPRPEELKAKMEMVIEAMLKLTALFIFKTLVMPLGFLVILLKGFKAIWGFDILPYLKTNRGQR